MMKTKENCAVDLTWDGDFVRKVYLVRVPGNEVIPEETFTVMDYATDTPIAGDFTKVDAVLGAVLRLRQDVKFREALDRKGVA